MKGVIAWVKGLFGRKPSKPSGKSSGDPNLAALKKKADAVGDRYKIKPKPKQK